MNAPGFNNQQPENLSFLFLELFCLIWYGLVWC